MSNYLYLVCEDHEPHLLSADEVSQHAHRDLEKVRGWVLNRDELVRLRLEQDDSTYGDYFQTHAITFLVNHLHCRLSAVDEVGATHQVLKESEQRGRPRPLPRRRVRRRNPW